MTTRQLPGVRCVEFRAASQPALLREIAKWLAAVEKRHRLPPFVLSIHLDLREEDLDAPNAFTALVYVDGVTSMVGIP